jgi:hypothetical protein
MAVEINTDGGGGGSGNVLMAFLLGAVLVIVGVVGFFMWDNYKSHQGAGTPPGVTLTIKGK